MTLKWRSWGLSEEGVLNMEEFPIADFNWRRPAIFDWPCDTIGSARPLCCYQLGFCEQREANLQGDRSNSPTPSSWGGDDQ
jgi:hypothetical protein